MTVWDFIPVVCKYCWPKMKCYLNGNCPDVQCLTLLTWWLAKIIQLWLPSHSSLSMLEWHVVVSHSVMGQDICIYICVEILRIRYLCLTRDLSRHNFTVSVLIRLVSLQMTRKTDLWKILKVSPNSLLLWGQLVWSPLCSLVHDLKLPPPFWCHFFKRSAL